MTLKAWSLSVCILFTLVGCDLSSPQSIRSLPSLPRLVAPSTTPNSDRTATLQWDSPTQREDGTALAAEEIAGYRVYRKLSTIEGSIDPCTGPDESVSVDADQTYSFTELVPGFHYFKVTAVDTNGSESKCSDVVFKEIR